MFSDRGNEMGSVAAPPKKKKKEWSEEEKSAYWRAKRLKRKERRKAAAADRRERQQEEWDKLSENERGRRRMEAITAHERRRAAEATADVLRVKRLADASLPVLVFDLSFAWCMTASDCRSVVLQIALAYSVLRRHAFPMRPVITSLCGHEGTQNAGDVHGNLLRPLCNFGGFQRYPPPIHDEHWSSLYATERVVFLTADTEEVLEQLEPDTVYVVGAFVDHNSRKFLSRDAARRYGVRMARLPLEESIEVGNRCKVLTVNHVVEVLCRYLECGDWSRAFDVLPTRRVNKTPRGRPVLSIGAQSASVDDVSGMSGDDDAGDGFFGFAN